MKITQFALTAVLWIGLFEATRADTHYVAQCGQTPVSTYTTWATAASNIQDAINVANEDVPDTVLVSNGVYATGVTAWSGSNRIAFRSKIVRSVNGPAVTIIKGQFQSGEPGAAGTVTNGPAAVRCVYITKNVHTPALIGFTLTNGASQLSAAGNYEKRAGGILNYSGNNIISNCIITGNSSDAYGAGVDGAALLYNCLLIGNGGDNSNGGGAANGSILYNCTLIGNFSGQGGGGYGCTFYNCLLTGNWSPYGGGAALCSLYNCTVVSNTAWGTGGGIYCCTVVCNSIIYFNTGCASSNWYTQNPYFLTFTNSCTAPVPVASGIGGWASGSVSWTNLVTNDPQVVNSAGGNCRLLKTSPCINTATNFSWMTDSSDVRSKDLDWYRRLDRFSSQPDMGCYEYVPQGTIYCFH